MKHRFSKKNKYDFIWNVSLVCPWNCEFCCTDATHVVKRDNNIVLFEKGLSEEHVVLDTEENNFIINQMLLDGVEPTIYDKALINRQLRGKELTYADKLNVLNNLRGTEVEIDFAGGDPLACYENFLVIKYASELFGKKNISITSTGHSVKRYGIDLIASVIGEYEFTFDETIGSPPAHRPSGYNSSNIVIAKSFSDKNIKTKAQLPIHSGNQSLKSIEFIYNSLLDAGIDELLLMRTFPVGRGRRFLLREGMYSNDEYIKIIETYRELEAKSSGPKVRLQCALKHLDNGKSSENPCDLMRESFGINPKGNLLLSAWATNDIGEPLSEDFVLGNLHQKSFEELLNTPKALNYYDRLDENFGHCKIFSYIFSPEQNQDGLFKRNDPLYVVSLQNIASKRNKIK